MNKRVAVEKYEELATRDGSALVAARADLSRTLSQLGLKLRTVLTLQQWQDVEKRFPKKN